MKYLSILNLCFFFKAKNKNSFFTFNFSKNYKIKQILIYINFVFINIKT